MARKSVEKVLNQFVRIESVGLVASSTKPKNPPEDYKQKSSAGDVAAEAEHLDSHAGHIDNPEPADLVYGMLPTKLIPLIKARFDELKSEGVKMRSDACVMSGLVVSYPGDKNSDEATEWISDVLLILKNDYGDNLKSVVVHRDEGFIHAHALLCDLKTLKVNTGLDPARTARKNDEDKKKIADAKGEKYELGGLKIQKQAYREFLDHWQNQLSNKYNHARKSGAMRARKHGTPRIVKQKLKLEEQKKLLLEQKEQLQIAIAATKATTQELIDIKKNIRDINQKAEVQFLVLEAEAKKMAAKGETLKAAELIVNIKKQRDAFPNYKPKALKH